MNIFRWLMRRAGWAFVERIPTPPRCVICVAPHTSNWDFVWGELATRSVGIKASFLIKDTWFKFPLGPFMRALGGIPVKQHTHTRVTDSVVAEFAARDRLQVAVTPEGTRGPNPNWHRGFLHIAREAGVPIVLAYIDYARREACIDRLFAPSGNVDDDIIAIKRYYSQFTARFPEKFVTGLTGSNPT